MLAHKKVKRGVQQLSDAEKFEAICRVERGETKAAVAREYRVPESTLRGWCKKAKLNTNIAIMPVQKPNLIPNTTMYRDCSFSKGSGSDEGSSTHPFSELEEDENENNLSVHHNHNHDQSKMLIGQHQDHNGILWNWLNRHHHHQSITSFCKLEDAYAHGPVNFRSQQGCFYNLWKDGNNYENYSVSPTLCDQSEQTLADSFVEDDEPLALVVQSKRRITEDSLNNNHCSIKNKICAKLDNNDNEGYNIPTNLSKNSARSKSSVVSVEEALKHGEAFLNWLQESSDPNVSVLQAMQIATLIKNIRSSHERNQNKINI